MTATGTPSRRKATWWRTPQRVWLRRALFQVHLWLGLLLTLYAIVIGLSGSALVFREQIERTRHPALFAVEPGPHRLSYDRLIRSVEGTRPGWRVSSLRGFGNTDALTLLLAPAHGTLSANYRAVIVQPYTGALLADQFRFAGALGWLSNLHFYLLAGRTGLLVSGWMSLGLALLCITGLILWWPGVSRWASALLLHRRRRWQRVNWDVHSVTGFWLALPLLLLSLTGCYFAFPGPVGSVVNALTFSPSQPLQHLSSAQPVRLHATPLTVDQAVAEAQRQLAPSAPLGYFALPSRALGAYSATGYYTGAAPYSKLVSLRLDAQTGQVLSREDTTEQPRGARIIQYVFALHFGSFAGDGALGTAVRWLWVLIGLSPALLAITGAVMFGYRKVWRAMHHRRLMRIASSPALVLPAKARTGTFT